MNTNLITPKLAASCLIIGLAVMFSCNTEDRLTINDTQEITEESVTDSYYSDMDDMASVTVAAPADNQYSGGRVATSLTIQDLRFCAGTVVTITPSDGSTPNEPKGVITVDFGTVGCSDQKGNIRTGKLIFTYSKWRFKPGSTIVTTTDNYTVNGVKLAGTRTLTNLNSESDDPATSVRKFNAVLTGGKATFLVDGTIAERESDITWTLSNSGTSADNFLTIEPTSTASGKTRLGKTYEVSVSEALVYKRFCGLAVTGIKKYNLNGEKEITIDYGNGDCDKSVIVTVNGTSRNFSID
ncbi:MAG: hypothetical protein ABJA70_07085 [Chryseolinea sp.]